MTNKEQELLDYILKFNRAHGYFPRQRSIAVSFNVSRQRIYELIKGLESKGHIRVENGLIVKVLKKDDYIQGGDLPIPRGHSSKEEGDNE